MTVQRFSRAEFLHERFTYHAGEHLVLFGPTQRAGKTFLGWHLLQAVNDDRLRKIAFCMKPRDRTMARFTRESGFREIPAWPPVPTISETIFRQPAPPGYTLWPPHTFDPAADNERIAEQFRKGMLDGYRRGDCILWLDEIYGLLADLKLEQELLALLTRGGGMGAGVWMATQKPSGTATKSLPGFVFNSPTHFFMAPDNDKRNRGRYADISGGMDPAVIDNIVTGLRPYEFLYVHAAGHACIVEAE